MGNVSLKVLEKDEPGNLVILVIPAIPVIPVIPVNPVIPVTFLS